MNVTPLNEPVDVDAIMAAVKARVAEKKARGLYSVDALAYEKLAEGEPWDPDRIEGMQVAAVVRQHLLVEPSSKPVIGKAVGLAKKFVVRAGFHNLQTITHQVTSFNTEMLGYATSVGVEVASLRRELDELKREIAEDRRVDQMDTRVVSLERVSPEARLLRLEADRSRIVPSVEHHSGQPALGAPGGFDQLRLEEWFPGDSDDALAALTTGANRVVALNCGDGRLLDSITTPERSGIDDRADLVAIGANAGRSLTHGDLIDGLNGLAAGSVDAVVVPSLVERLDHDRLAALVRGLSGAVDRSGRAIVTVRNPRCQGEMRRHFWMDPRRLRPIDPETIGLMLLAAGFDRFELIWREIEDVPLPVGAEPPPIEAVSRSCAVVAHHSS